MVEFAPEFPKEKMMKLELKIAEAGKLLDKLTENHIKRPKKIEVMTKKDIAMNKNMGGNGHGIYYPDRNIIRINPNSREVDILVAYIHENIHCIFQDASETLVSFLTSAIAFQLDIGNFALMLGATNNSKV